MTTGKNLINWYSVYWYQYRTNFVALSVLIWVKILVWVDLYYSEEWIFSLVWVLNGWVCINWWTYPRHEANKTSIYLDVGWLILQQVKGESDMWWLLNGPQTLPDWMRLKVVERKKSLSPYALFSQVIHTAPCCGLCVYHDGVHVFNEHTCDGHLVSGWKGEVC